MPLALPEDDFIAVMNAAQPIMPVEREQFLAQLGARGDC